MTNEITAKHSPLPWRYENVSGAGLQLYAPVPRTNAVEYTIKQGEFPVYGMTSRATHHECYEHMIAYEAFVQFSPQEWDALQEANAEFIVRACNSHDALVKAVEFALTTPGMIKGRDSLVAALSLAKEEVE